MPDSGAPARAVRTPPSTVPAQRLPVEMTVVVPVRSLPKGMVPVAFLPAGEANIQESGEKVVFAVMENACFVALRDQQIPVLEGLPSSRRPCLVVEPNDVFHAMMKVLVARAHATAEEPDPATKPEPQAKYDPLLCCRLVEMLDERWRAQPFDPLLAPLFHGVIRTNRGDETFGDLLDSCAGRERGWWKASEAKQ
jgi:hypothetical protein